MHICEYVYIYICIYTHTEIISFAISKKSSWSSEQRSSAIAIAVSWFFQYSSDCGYVSVCVCLRE